MLALDAVDREKQDLYLLFYLVARWEGTDSLVTQSKQRAAPLLAETLVVEFYAPYTLCHERVPDGQHRA